MAILACLLAGTPLHASYITAYDGYFKKWEAFYAPWEDWRWFKAQSIAESNLNQKARSGCGAIGLLQLMPKTAAGLGVNPLDPEGNIQGGIKYDSQMWKIFKTVPDNDNRRWFQFGAYNAGPGWIIKAHKAAGTNLWQDICLKLPTITGKANSNQTISYVQHIRNFYKTL